MTTAVAPPRWQAAVSAVESDDLASRLAGPNGLELVVEMAHDFRSPLTSILFLAESLRSERNSPISESQRRQLGLIYSAALCLCTAANDVLELVHGGDRLAEKKPSPFSITEAFGSVRDMIQPLAEEKGLPLYLKPPVPDQRLGHARALSRVLLNLTTNALKFTDQGFVEISGRVRDGAHVEFSVRDTGPGIDPAAVRTLYQPFRKLPSASRQHFESSGLGLAICRKLVTAMGSELRVETRPNWGTRFFFELELPPCTAAAAAGRVL
jgi:signal transduction histidine kinase